MSRPRSIPGKVMDFRSKIHEVISQTSCDAHNVPAGEPCYELRMDSREDISVGVCNKRSSKMFNGSPSQKFKEKR